LVNALLNSDPAARPSLDEIANHEFFKSGYFPKSIPVSATTLEPEWPTTGQDFSTLAACCQEWRRNYDSVAKAAGVGIDSTGTPVRPVGDGAGKPLEPVPFSRPASAASSTDTEPVESYKPLGKRRENKLKGPAKPNSGYILPEALSPRDGHARMRNMGILRGIPSRLGLKPPISRTELNPSSSNVIPEETEPEDSEKDSVARPIRHLEKKPIRKTSRIQEPEAPDPVPALVLARAPVAPKETVKPVGRLQKPNGSEEAEPPVVKTEIQTRRVTSELPLRAASIRRPEVPETQTTISAEGQAPVRTLREKSPEHLSPNPIPFGSNLSSRVGKAIPETSTGAILTSFQPVVANLTAFTCSNIEALSPPPPATVEAVRAFRAGEDNRAVFVKKWVDYTNKYGLAYMLSDGTAATLYNDNTSFVVDALGGNVVEWITHSLSEPAQTVRGRPESVFRRLTTEMAVIKQKSKSSEGLRSKLAIWRRTTNYMNQCLGVGESWDFERKEVVREPTFGQHADTEHMLWISHYARLRRCVVFRLIDGTIQVSCLSFIPYLYE
jgi:polo-like kinase 1